VLELKREIEAGYQILDPVYWILDIGCRIPDMGYQISGPLRALRF
jgi:hypothetical protein